MRFYLELWLTGPLWRRFALIAAGIALTLAMFWLQYLAPQRYQQRRLEQKNLQTEQQVAVLRHEILALPAREPSPPVPELVPFSLMALVKRSGGGLLHWSPEEGSLHLLLPWEKLPPLFLLLAEYQGLSVPSFTLTREGERIKTVLKLEFADEES